MDSRVYEFVVVGSGMGGSTVAVELSRRGRDVLVLEQGVEESSLGSFKDTLRFYDGNARTQTPKKAKEGAILWRTFMAGGWAGGAAGEGGRGPRPQRAA